MQDKEKQELKALMEKEIITLKQGIGSFEESSRPVAPDDSIGRLTRMDAIGNKSMNEASLIKAKNSLASLTMALEDIDDSDFGICDECEDDIPFKRLMIMPGTRLCVKCASMNE